MKIQTVIDHKEWSNRIIRRGIRRVAKEAKVDYALLSRAVNDRVTVTERQLEKLRIATNKLRPLQEKNLVEALGFMLEYLVDKEAI